MYYNIYFLSVTVCIVVQIHVSLAINVYTINTDSYCNFSLTSKEIRMSKFHAGYK